MQYCQIGGCTWDVMERHFVTCAMHRADRGRIEELAERFRAPAAAPAPVSADAKSGLIWQRLPRAAPQAADAAWGRHGACWKQRLIAEEDFPALGGSSAVPQPPRAATAEAASAMPAQPSRWQRALSCAACPA